MNTRVQPTPPPDDANLTDYRLERIETAVSKMAESIQDLVTLEQKYSEQREALGRAFKANEETNQRVRALELDMAVVKQSRNGAASWVQLFATAFVTAIAAVLVAHVMK